MFNANPLLFRIPSNPDRDSAIQKAFRTFHRERAQFYKEHFKNEPPYQTFEKNSIAHSIQHPGFLILMNPDNEDHYISSKRKFILASFLPLRWHDFSFTYKGKHETAHELVSRFTSAAHAKRLYISARIGTHPDQDLHVDEKKSYNPMLVFYLLPEDYHYFHHVHEFFAKSSLIPTSTPTIHLGS